jgi:hypothetical protein
MLCSVDSSGRIEAKWKRGPGSRVMSHAAYGAVRVLRRPADRGWDLLSFILSMLTTSPPHPVSSSLSPHHSLGRRRSSPSLLDADPVPPPQPAVPQQLPTQSMIVAVVSRILQWLHLQPQHTFSWSNPPSPRSSTEKLVLPLSASSQKTSFTDVPSHESPTHHFPSVMLPHFFGFSFTDSVSGAYSHCLRHMYAACIYCSCVLLHLDSSNYSRVA